MWNQEPILEFCDRCYALSVCIIEIIEATKERGTGIISQLSNSTGGGTKG